jgi:hypothetical protein
MNKDVRKGVTQAKFNEQASGIFFSQVFVSAVAIGLWASSWIVFGVAFVGLIFAATKPQTQKILVLVFGISWGVLAWFLAGIFFGLAAQVVLGILFAMAGLGINLSAIEWVKDMGDNATAPDEPKNESGDTPS